MLTAANAQAPGANEESYSHLFTSYVSELPSIPTKVIKPASVWRDVIRAAATRNGADPDLAERIAYCESGFKPSVQNAHSTASGLFQFLDSTWKSQSLKYGVFTQKNDPYGQIEVATRMLADGGAHHWDASKSCWAR